jgi:hypothetical protein
MGDEIPLAHKVATSRCLCRKRFGLSFHNFPEHSLATKWDFYIFDVRATAFGIVNYSSMTFVPFVGYAPTMNEICPIRCFEITRNRTRTS